MRHLEREKTMIYTAREIQKQVKQLHADLDERLEKLRAKRDEAKKRGIALQEVSRLENEIESLKDIYEQTFTRKAVELKDAQDRESRQSTDAAFLRQKVEDDKRSTALKAYVRAGGKPEEFDAAYTEIQQEQLKKAINEELEGKRHNPVSL